MPIPRAATEEVDGLGGRQFAAAGVLDVCFFESGPSDGVPVVLLHGFPYDVRSYVDVAPAIAAAGGRVIVPYLRGYGPTRFQQPETPRSGQQAALGSDLHALLDVLHIEQAVVGGYDWGGRAACVLAALHPERVLGLVTVGGYNVQDITLTKQHPETPAREKVKWYQHYFQTELGRRGLEQQRDELCRLLWQDWSPTWPAADTQFELTAPSLHNPDFVDVVIHSYRHRFGAAAGDPAYEQMERRLALQPQITVPTISLAPDSDGFGANRPDDDREQFSGPFSGQILRGVGHNPPQEQPATFSTAVITLIQNKPHSPT